MTTLPELARRNLIIPDPHATKRLWRVTAWQSSAGDQAVPVSVAKVPAYLDMEAVHIAVGWARADGLTADDVDGYYWTAEEVTNG